LKKLLLHSSFLAVALLAQDEILSQQKQEILKLQEQKAQYDGDFLQKNWLSPVILSYDENDNDYNDITTRTKTVSIDQPIFKTGGILYAIKYANAVRDTSLKSVEATKRELIAQAVELLFNYRKTQKQLQKQELLLENNYIEIKRKTEQYQAGLIDSSDLDRALLEKNQNATALLDMQKNLSEIKANFAKISDLDIETATPPQLYTVEKDDYVQNNIDLLAQQSSVKSKDYQTFMTLSQYLPQVSLYGSRNWNNGTSATLPDEYDRYGVKITMPLSINAYDDVQRTRYEYLKSNAELLDSKRALEQDYRKTMTQISYIEKKIALSQEDASMYENLVAQTKDQVYIGTLTKYDLQTMQNSLEIKRLDKAIYEIEKNILLLEIYIKTYKG